MRALVIAGSAKAEPLGSPFIEPDKAVDLLVLADSGADSRWPQWAKEAAVVLVGDLDSISSAGYAACVAEQAEIIRLPCAKDETDLEFALRIAIERGAQYIDVLGAVGGPRVDHLLGTVSLLTAPWLKSARVRLLDRHHEIMLAQGELELVGRPGDIVSLIPLTPSVHDVRTEGLLYALNGEPLIQGSTRGVSNEFLGDWARIAHGEGDLLVVHYCQAKGETVGSDADVDRAAEPQVACQFSLYPLRQSSIDEAIRAGIEAAARVGAAAGLTVRVQTLSTLMLGPRDVVFAAARAAFDAASTFGPVVMVGTYTTGAPSEAVVQEIQQRHVEQAQQSERGEL